MAIVAYSAPPYSAGGVAAAHFNLFRSLRRLGEFDVKLFTFGDLRRKSTTSIVRCGTPVWWRKLLGVVNGIAFRFLAPGKPGYQVFDILSSQWGASRMSKMINDFAPEVIIISDHGAPALALKKSAHSKVILVSHHNPARFVSSGELSETRSNIDAAAAVWLEQQTMKKVDVVVCPSNYMKTWFLRTYKFHGNVIVIPNLLDSTTLKKTSLKKLKRRPGSSKETVIYMPSAGSAAKGGKYLRRIIDGLLTNTSKKVAFYIPGYITEEFLENASQLKQNAKLFLPGQITYHTHIALMKESDFGISPSLLENYSMAILEAVYCGLPMIAFKTGGNSEIIKDGQNGYLVKAGDVNAILKKALPLLNSSKLRAMKQKTIRYSRRFLSPQIPLREYARLIKSL